MAKVITTKMAHGKGWGFHGPGSISFQVSVVMPAGIPVVKQDGPIGAMTPQQAKNHIAKLQAAVDFIDSGQYKDGK